MVMDGSETIPFCLALSELVLDDAKVEILLILWHFLVVFWLLPPLPKTRPFSDTLMFWYVKGVHVIYTWAKFH